MWLQIEVDKPLGLRLKESKAKGGGLVVEVSSRNHFEPLVICLLHISAANSAQLPIVCVLALSAAHCPSYSALAISWWCAYHWLGYFVVLALAGLCDIH